MLAEVPVGAVITNSLPVPRLLFPGFARTNDPAPEPILKYSDPEGGVAIRVVEVAVVRLPVAVPKSIV
jgi:hypothetical protein